MIEIGENYYLISKEEITDEMEFVANGLYKFGENLYEVIGDKNSNPATSEKLNEAHSSTMASNNYLTVFFIFSVILLAFAVLCIYLGISTLVNYGKIINQSNQLGATGEILTNGVGDLLRNGIYWILGGVASLILGGILSLIYNSQK